MNLRIFDPGGIDGCRQVLQSLVSSEHEQDQLDSFFQLQESKPVHLRVFRPAILYTPHDGVVPVPRVLFDSGALSASYINRSLVDRYRDELAPCILSVDSHVTLGDNATTNRISEAVKCTLVFLDAAGQRVVLKSSFSVIDTGPDIIVGLPDIVFKLLPFYFEMLLDGSSSAPSSECLSSLHLYEGSDLLEYPSDPLDIQPGLPVLPWSEPPVLAVEESESEVPPISFFAIDSIFSLDTTRQQQLEEFAAMIEGHVDAEFAASHPEFKTYLLNEAVNVFVPDNWDGIRDIPPVEFTFRKDMPDYFSAHCRSVHPAREEAVNRELQRLIDLGILVPNPRSPYVSAIVDADKASPPWVRICGAYDVEANKHIVPEQAFIPSVIHELEKFKGYKYFIDIDMVHSFRQFPLADFTSGYLSITTKKFGVLRPRFMPEGVVPATAVLQTYVREIFADFADWVVNIFDNFTICCHSYADGIAKFKKFIDRCRERNLFLQFKKTFIMISEVSFFGYVCNGDGYRLADSRKATVLALPFPSGTPKQCRKVAWHAQGFLQYFRDFVPSFSELSAALAEMTRADFNWTDPSKWTIDYRTAFEDLKAACVNSMMSYFPDLSLDWFLIPDASEHAVGALLVQVRVLEDGLVRHELIGCVSQKLSATAMKWDTIKRECYAIYFGMTRLGYFLRHRPFVVLTDHANLQWIEKSSVPIIVRWRLVMSGYPILAIKHIPGKINPADYLTRDGAPAPSPLELFPPDRLHCLLSSLSSLLSLSEMTSAAVVPPEEPTDATPPVTTPLVPPTRTPPPVMTSPQLSQCEQWDAMLRQVHGGSSLHWGVAETWRRIQHHFPGSNIPYRYVQDWVRACGVCQKYRAAGPQNRLAPIIRHLKAPDARGRTSIDCLEISPAAEDGSRYIYVIVNICTGFAFGFVTKTKTKEDAANAMAVYISLFGLTTTWVSDPGSDFTSDAIDCLSRYFGFRFLFTLVSRPQANGVEPVNKQVLRHVRTLVADHRLARVWHTPRVLAVIFTAINQAHKSEHGIDPFTATFGSLDTPYFRRLAELPMDSSSISADYVRELDAEIRAAREIIAETHQAIIAKRTAPNLVSPQNFFQPGDLVFVDIDDDRVNKLQANKLGPYEVVSHEKNDVVLRDLHSNVVKPAVDVTRVSLYDGSREEAMDLAMRDNDEFPIVRFCRLRGNPATRKTVEVDVLFGDGTQVWLPWTPALAQTVPYEVFCQSDPMFQPLLHSAATVRAHDSALNKQPITTVSPGQTVYVNLRWYSHTWYKELESLPDRYDVAYLVPCRYGKLTHRGRRIELIDPVFGNHFAALDHCFVHYYGWCTSLASYAGPYILVDKAFHKAHPELHDTRPQASHLVSLPLATDSPLYVLQRLH